MSDTFFDEIEIEHEIQRSDHDDDETEADANHATLMNEWDLNAEHAEHNASEINEGDAASGSDEAELEILRRFDEA
jgi:hypothetical protein